MIIIESFNAANCPCKDCTKRKIGCHGTCNDYKLWVSEGQRKAKIAKSKKNYGGHIS